MSRGTDGFNDVDSRATVQFEGALEDEEGENEDEDEAEEEEKEE